MVEIEGLIIGLLLTGVMASFMIYVWDTGGYIYLLNMKALVFIFVFVALLTRFSSMWRIP